KLRKWKIAVCGFIKLYFISIFHSITQAKCTIVMKIISQKKITHASLLRRSFQCGMRINGPHQCKPAGIRNTNNSSLTIIIGNIFYKPVNGIISISAFINCAFLCSMNKRLVNLHDAFTFVFTTYILENKNVSFPCHICKLKVISEWDYFIILKRHVSAIGSPLDKNRNRLCGIYRR